MSLQSYLDNLNSSNHNVNELLDLLDDPQNALTFFGGRVVTIANREGSVYLNELIEKVIHAINPVFEQNGNPNQSCGEILNKLELCIQKSNAIIEGANCLLRVLNYLREQFFGSPPIDKIRQMRGDIPTDFLGKQGRMAQIQLNSATIYHVRDSTNAQVQYDLARWDGTMNGVTMHFYRPQYPSTRGDSMGKQCILGRFDAFSIKGCAFAYGADYELLENDQPPLNFTYIAALNIGESGAAVSDRNDYKLADGTLDIESVIADTQKIFMSGLVGQKQTRSKHFIWNPVGMGAFLRKISQDNPKMAATLRNGLAVSLLKAFEKDDFAAHHLHICLPNVSEESEKNLKAFSRAVWDFPHLKGRVKLYENMDMLDLGAELHEDGGANLIVAANRHLLGNHWFNDRALSASDENFVRRNPNLAFYTTIVNGGSYIRDRSPNEIVDGFKFYDPRSYVEQNPGTSLKDLLQECFDRQKDFRPAYALMKQDALMKEEAPDLPEINQVRVPRGVIGKPRSYDKYIEKLLDANRHLLKR